MTKRDKKFQSAEFQNMSPPNGTAIEQDELSQNEVLSPDIDPIPAEIEVVSIQDDDTVIDDGDNGIAEADFKSKKNIKAESADDLEAIELVDESEDEGEVYEELESEESGVELSELNDDSEMNYEIKQADSTDEIVDAEIQEQVPVIYAPSTGGKRFGKLIRFSKKFPDATSEESDSKEELVEVRPAEEIQSELTVLLLGQERLEGEIVVARRDATAAETTVKEFADFVASAEATLAWRLKVKFTQNLGLVDGDIASVVSVAESIDVTELGLLVRLKQMFLRRFWTSIFIALIVIAIFIAVQYFLSDNESGIAQYIDDYPRDLFYFQVLQSWAVYFIGILIWYYRSWSNYERSLQLAEVRLVWVRDSLKSSQDAKSKLTKLYAHADQWTQLIALSLFYPWQIDPKWESSKGSILSDEKLPNSVTVAQTIEGSLGAMVALETTATARLIRPGWREQVFIRQIVALAKHHGIKPGKLDYEVLDKDSPSIPNGTRKFFMENFRDEAVQVSVARSYLSELSTEVQTVGLLESKPPVKNDYVDELRAIAEDLDMLGEVQEEKSWDGFLLEIVGAESDPIIPISPFSFTDHAITENCHGNPLVSIQMPDRLRTLVQNFDANRVKINSYEDKARLPLDLVVRVDSVGPLDPETLKLWGRASNGIQNANEEGANSSPAQDLTCKSCGRKNCETLRPGNTTPCAHSGL